MKRILFILIATFSFERGKKRILLYIFIGDIKRNKRMKDEDEFFFFVCVFSKRPHERL